VVDFRLTIPPASAFDDVWATGVTQNHVRAPGRYRLYLARGIDASSARRRVVEVYASDSSGNTSRVRFGVADLLSGS
jgi:hypothetical protein